MYTEPVGCFGCTFDNCDRNFTDTADWKDHERAEHIQLDAWLCDIEPCKGVLQSLVGFHNHLEQRHGISDEDNKRNKSSQCHLAAKWCGSFWCGFCKRIIDTSQARGRGWAETRFSHIEAHFQQGLRVYDWLTIWGKTKGHGTTALVDGPEVAVSKNTILLSRESQKTYTIRTMVEGAEVLLDVYKDAMSGYKDWIVLHPVHEWMKAIQDYQNSIPGSAQSGEGVCRPHEFLAVAPQRTEHRRAVRERFEVDFVSRDMSDKTVWDGLGPQAILMMLILYKGKEFNVKEARYALQSWTIDEHGVNLKFDGCDDETVPFANSWNLRGQRITIAVPVERFKCPPLWKRD